jgi:hypothetical protein
MAAFKNAVRNGVVVETAVGFGAELDAFGSRHLFGRREALVGRIEQSPFFEAW